MRNGDYFLLIVGSPVGLQIVGSPVGLHGTLFNTPLTDMYVVVPAYGSILFDGGRRLILARVMRV